MCTGVYMYALYMYKTTICTQVSTCIPYIVHLYNYMCTDVYIYALYNVQNNDAYTDVNMYALYRMPSARRHITKRAPVPRKVTSLQKTTESLS